MNTTKKTIQGNTTLAFFLWVIVSLLPFGVKAQQVKPAPQFEVDGSLYPWDIHDEGITLMLDNMVSIAGVNAVYVLAVMHKEHRPFATPRYLHNPVRPSWDAEDSRVYFHPQMNLYGRIKPVLSDFSWLNEKDWLKITVDSAHARGLKAGAEVSHTYISQEILKNNPDLQQRDINNKPTGRPCPNNPDVREYLLALFGDMAKNYKVDFLQTCMYLFAEGNPEKGGTCFCESCRKEAKAAGFDLEAAIPILKENVNAQPQLGQWLSFRRASTAKIYRLISERIHRENPNIDFRLNEIYPYTKINNNATGLYLEDLKGVINSIVIQEHTEQDGHASTLRRSWLATDRLLLGTDFPILAGVPTRMAATPELVRSAISVSLEYGVKGIAIKHYDGSPYSLLRATRNGLYAANVSGFTPIMGVEAEDMALTGYVADSYLNEKGIKTSSTGTATYKFPYPSGTYTVVISYADEKDGQSSLSFFIKNNQKANWILNEDVGVWRRKAIPHIKINQGDEVKVIGTANGAETAKIDFIEFIPDQKK